MKYRIAMLSLIALLFSFTARASNEGLAYAGIVELVVYFILIASPALCIISYYSRSRIFGNFSILFFLLSLLITAISIVTENNIKGGGSMFGMWDIYPVFWSPAISLLFLSAKTEKKTKGKKQLYAGIIKSAFALFLAILAANSDQFEDLIIRPLHKNYLVNCILYAAAGTFVLSLVLYRFIKIRQTITGVKIARIATVKYSMLIGTYAMLLFIFCVMVTCNQLSADFTFAIKFFFQCYAPVLLITLALSAATGWLVFMLPGWRNNQTMI